jgi:hypothetical protein
LIDWCRRNPAIAILASALAICFFCCVVITHILLLQESKGLAKTTAISPFPAQSVAGGSSLSNDELSKARERTLQAALSQADTSTVLRTAWQQFCLEPFPGSDPQPQRFLGLLEGRTGLVPPIRWELQLVCRALRSRLDLGLAALNDYQPSCPFLKKVNAVLVQLPEVRHGTELGPEAGPSGPLNLRKAGRQIEVILNKSEVKLPEQVFGQLVAACSSESVCICEANSSELYMALYPKHGGSFRLIKVDRKTGDLCWQAPVKGLPTSPGGGGPLLIHEAVITLGPKEVAIFGYHASLNCYLEAFDRDTGARAYRFTTN